MAIIKPTKPDSELPKTWGGTQYPYTEEQIAEGLPEAIPTIIDGGTLNYEKKGVFERMEYVTQVSDAVAGAPIKKTLITNANNQFEYAGIGVYSYSATQTYALDDYVIYSTNEGTKIYKSLSNNNIGKELTNETYWEELSLGGGSGLEIGDIGIAPLGIDETQNKRRYLNGQVISQAQFVSFTNKIKAAIELTPSLATSETNWQAEVTNSVNGTCGKFVIDDEVGTIRLPKYPEYVSKEYVESAVIGNGMALGVTDGTRYGGMSIGSTSTGLFGVTSAYGLNVGSSNTSGDMVRNVTAGITTDPTKSGVVADLKNATTEKIPCKWFIQVATGVEESVDVTREIELNNPFSLLDYKWSEYEITNASWLLSNGQFNSGATYISVYNLLLEIYNGTVAKDGVSVKMSTEAYTDTDFVINTADTTFRLPIKVKLASGNAVVGNGMALGLTNGSYNGGLVFGTNGTSAVTDSQYGEQVYQGTAHGNSSIGVFGVTTDPEKSGLVLADNDMYLYFYVGETIQDANIIASSQVLTTVADCVRKSSATDRETVVGWGIPDYSAMVLIQAPATGSTFTVPYDCEYLVMTSNTGGILEWKLNNSSGITIFKGVGGPSNVIQENRIRLAKGTKIYVVSNVNTYMHFAITPLKGVN